MSNTVEDNIKAFVTCRDELLTNGDIDGLFALAAKHGSPAPSDPALREIAFHKARTAAKEVSMELRRASKDWLEGRGYKSLDDGDIS